MLLAISASFSGGFIVHTSDKKRKTSPNIVLKYKLRLCLHSAFFGKNYDRLPLEILPVLQRFVAPYCQEMKVLHNYLLQRGMQDLLGQTERLQDSSFLTPQPKLIAHSKIANRAYLSLHLQQGPRISPNADVDFITWLLDSKLGFSPNLKPVTI
ncbi:hypothetical protein J6590_025302 [Homalodisca vitripennis]|nr:hypothetical protein J6590_025302 [Homalodisca vitripennis]